jgi:tetraacyldisaccharide 4'-kinase
LPRGLLREPLPALRRASCVLLTRSDQVDESTRQCILDTIRRWTSAPVHSSHFEPTQLINSGGDVRTLEQIQHQHAAAFCGIGNPVGFRRTLTGCGVAIPDERFRGYPDHYAYQPADCEVIGSWARSVGAECLLTTHKDLVKIPAARLGGVAVWALEIELRFEDHASEIQFGELLRGVVGR